MVLGYLHCIGGVSGDMLLGAIVDAGIPAEDLQTELAGFAVGGFSISACRSHRGGVDGTLVSVDIGNEPRKFDTVGELIDTLEASDFTSSVIIRSREVLERLAQAEASVHGIKAEDVHLHELGTVDTLVDVVGTVLGMEKLGIDRLFCSPLPTGSGIFQSEHGMLPAPSPATAALFGMSNAPTIPPPGDILNAGEMVTPTGAAIVTTIAAFNQPAMHISRIGYGLGSRDPSAYPNVTALWIGESSSPVGVSTLRLVETNIDDMSSEMFPYVSECLFEIGARDVWITPIQMKKGRPGMMLSVLVTPELESQAVSIILNQTTTLGVRVTALDRYEAEREIVSIGTSVGKVAVKIKSIDGKPVAVSPEFEECRRIARQKKISLQKVFRIVQAAAEAELLDTGDI